MSGGIRYLEKAIKHLDYDEFKLVTEALHERTRVLHNAPHLTRPLPILLPVRRLRCRLCAFTYVRIVGLMPRNIGLD